MRGQAADTKAGQLVGFTAVILAIDVSLGGEVFDRGIFGVYSDVFAFSFAVSLASLVAAAFVGIRGLLQPPDAVAFPPSGVNGLAGEDLVMAESVEIKRTLIRTYGQDLVSEERINKRKLSFINRASLLLMIGVFALAAEGGTLVIENLAENTSKKPSSQHASKANLPVSVAAAVSPDRRPSVLN